MRRLGPDDGGLLDAAVSIFAESVGEGYVTFADLAALTASLAPEAGVYVAVADDDVAGAATVDRAPPDLVQHVQDLGSPGLAERRVGRLRTGAVRPPFRRRGIGSALMDARLAHLRAAGCTAAIALAWVSGNRDNSQGLLRAHGFARVAEVPDYWHGGPPCPLCGGPCHCTAAVHAVLW